MNPLSGSDLSWDQPGWRIWLSGRLQLQKGASPLHRGGAHRVQWAGKWRAALASSMSNHHWCGERRGGPHRDFCRWRASGGFGQKVKTWWLTFSPTSASVRQSTAAFQHLYSEVNSYQLGLQWLANIRNYMDYENLLMCCVKPRKNLC